MHASTAPVLIVSRRLSWYVPQNIIPIPEWRRTYGSRSCAILAQERSASSYHREGTSTTARRAWSWTLGLSNSFPYKLYSFIPHSHALKNYTEYSGRPMISWRQRKQFPWSDNMIPMTTKNPQTLFRCFHASNLLRECLMYVPPMDLPKKFHRAYKRIPDRRYGPWPKLSRSDHPKSLRETWGSCWVWTWASNLYSVRGLCHRRDCQTWRGSRCSDGRESRVLVPCWLRWSI